MGKSSSLSFEMAREFGWQRRQMDCSPSSSAKLPLSKGCKKKACEEDAPPSLPALVAAPLKASNVTTLVVVIGFCTLLTMG
jgi:hypothetical protein